MSTATAESAPGRTALTVPGLALLCSLQGFLTGAAAPARAGEADVTAAEVRCDAGHSCTFTVTVRHDDTGWDHYADHWRILDPDGVELGRRVLLHPHETEQPFTRSLSGVQVPAGTREVTVQAHDNVHDYGGATRAVTMP